MTENAKSEPGDVAEQLAEALYDLRIAQASYDGSYGHDECFGGHTMPEKLCDGCERNAYVLDDARSKADAALAAFSAPRKVTDERS